MGERLIRVQFHDDAELAWLNEANPGDEATIPLPSALQQYADEQCDILDRIGPDVPQFVWDSLVKTTTQPDAARVLAELARLAVQQSVDGDPKLPATVAALKRQESLLMALLSAEYPAQAAVIRSGTAAIWRIIQENIDARKGRAQGGKSHAEADGS